MELIEATYIATRVDRPAEELAENIAREQSLESPRELISEAIAERFLGRVLAVEAKDADRHVLRIGYPAELASGQIGQLFHLLYGNVSFYPRVRLVELRLPESLLAAWPGPLGGLAGIRQALGVADRALLMTVLKPRGSSPEVLADLARRFALGGGDLIKDDQNLVETDLPTFRKRVTYCSQAIDNAQNKTGKATLYLPHVAGSGDHLERQLETVARLGLPGVVLCPWVMGLETAASAARRHGLMWLAHPAAAGTLTESTDRGINAAVLLGTLVRAAGADISIFPGSGGRISSGERDTGAATARALTAPLGSMRASLPCAGGGKTLELAAQTAAEQGPDRAIVVGGDLLTRGAGIERATRETIAQLAALATDHRS